ncbi:MAG: hypothetical protein AB8F78_09245 [Saprospiraceae bacterium]
MPNIQLKRLGKRKMIEQAWSLDGLSIHVLRDLVTAFVTREVARYNSEVDNPTHIAYLLPAEIQVQGESGKIGFGDQAKRSVVNLEEAIDAALLAHTDGLYAVFIDEGEIQHLDDAVELREDTTIAIIRLTFLAGRMC